jgi:hypothetical protein
MTIPATPLSTDSSTVARPRAPIDNLGTRWVAVPSAEDCRGISSSCIFERPFPRGCQRFSTHVSAKLVEQLDYSDRRDPNGPRSMLRSAVVSP